MSLASLAGQQFEKYDVLEEVGHGGMAVVYRARDRDLDREVAIKVLHAHLADREESRQRLRREAITVAKLRHENIVEIYDYSGVDGDESYIVTEFIHGVTLRKWLDTRWKPRPVVAALIIHRLCLALVPAHEFGIVHRDIKPENVMIREDGALKLMDFGIAQILDHQKLTMTGQLLGSPAYMAPELISGKPVDARTDLFAVGIMLYQLATAQLPFHGRNPHEVLNRIADCAYTRAAAVNSLVDEELETIIAKALAREPDGRYASARALANDLEDYLAGMGVDPESGVLEAYFQDADAKGDALDAQVVAHLLERAEQATAAGNGPRALNLLGRVLEYEPQNPRANQLLDAARVRGKRMRQLLVGVAAVSIVGMVTAAAALMRNPPQPLALADADADGAAERYKDRAGGPNDSGVVVPVADGRAPRVMNTRPDRPSSDDEGDAAEAGGDPPGESGGGRGGRPRTITRPSTPLKTAPLREIPCIVRVEGLAVSTLNHHWVSVAGGTKQKYDRERAGYVVNISSNDLAVRFEGERYQGRQTLTREACEKGSVTLTARAKPIQLKLRDTGGTPPGEILVQCTGDRSCKKDFANKWKAKVKEGEDRATFTLQFNDSETGFLEAKKTVELFPGPNPLTITLEDMR